MTTSIGAPGVTQSRISHQPFARKYAMSQAFLVFGNRSVTATSTPTWSMVTPEQRVGVLANLGTSSQTNPFTNRDQPYNYNFDGITFYTGDSPNSGLGAFVAAAGPNAFVIGAPNYHRRRPSLLHHGHLELQRVARSGQPRHPHGLPGVDHRHLRGHGESRRAALARPSLMCPISSATAADDLVIGEPTASLNGKTDNGGVFVFSASSNSAHAW